MDVYTKWAFEKVGGALQKVILAELLDVCNDDFYVMKSDITGILRRHADPHKTLLTLQDKGLIRIQKHGKSIECIKILYP